MLLFCGISGLMQLGVVIWFHLEMTVASILLKINLKWYLGNSRPCLEVPGHHLALPILFCSSFYSHYLVCCDCILKSKKYGGHWLLSSGAYYVHRALGESPWTANILTMCIHFQKQTELLTQALKHIESCRKIWKVLEQTGEPEILQPEVLLIEYTYLNTGLGIDEDPSCLVKDGDGVFCGN